MHTLRVPFGYWEAKDSDDNLDREIKKKFDSLGKLLRLFFSYERPEIEAFRKAVEQFKTDLPAVLETLRAMIAKAYEAESKFQAAVGEFLIRVREAVNPFLNEADVREMLIQHVLTGEVFHAVFPGTSYHEDNNVARELYKLEATFFTGNTKFQTLRGLESYYAAIRKTAAEISTHHEKQGFLKAIYENFYKVYNPKAADRLGVVYTPNEIVRFIINSADWLCEKHFDRNLIHKDVDILDPATGTGTFICELIDYFAGQKDKLSQKYLNGLHANEVAILPYYVANLNIEATYAAVTGSYEEFPGLCFADTLDNIYALRKHSGHMDNLFGTLSDDNVKRIQAQNRRTISVIVGNPPYNANQLNENENNKNRNYTEIDKRIKQTYVKESKAQKTKAYDMYARFFRWATDRLDANGIVAFVTNRGFIDKKTFDGFRAVAAKEFNAIYIIDLGGDVRDNPKLSGTTHNVFGIQIGVAISFMCRRRNQKGCRIFYARRPEMELADDKLSFLSTTRMDQIHFDEISPDKNHNWVNLITNDFQSLLPLATRETKATHREVEERAIFKLFSLGVATNRDEWVYDISKKHLVKKAQALIETYESERRRWKLQKESTTTGEFVSRSIKWTSELEDHLERGTALKFNTKRIRRVMYRPFCYRWNYYDHVITHRLYQQDAIFPVVGSWGNMAIVYTQPGSQKPFMVCAVCTLPDLHFVGAAAGTECLPMYRIEEGKRIENITDWGLKEFRTYYGSKTGKLITKGAIFHYIYAVLCDPLYREEYALNLKREYPRIPFYSDFWAWAEWGKALTDLHIGFERAAPIPIKRIERKRTNHNGPPETLLRIDKENGLIEIDTDTVLTGIPLETWRYVLGNRTAVEWVVEKYKEKIPKDPSIRDKFDLYRFADHKEEAIDLIRRVVTVSIETVEIIDAMKSAPR